jgi:hypothetical protein
METLVIILVATLGKYRQRKVSVPDSADFQAFDLKALRSPDQHKDDARGRSSGRKESYVLQTTP